MIYFSLYPHLLRLRQWLLVLKGLLFFQVTIEVLRCEAYNLFKFDLWCVCEFYFNKTYYKSNDYIKCITYTILSGFFHTWLLIFCMQEVGSHVLLLHSLFKIVNFYCHSSFVMTALLRLFCLYLITYFEMEHFLMKKKYLVLYTYIHIVKIQTFKGVLNLPQLLTIPSISSIFSSTIARRLLWYFSSLFWGLAFKQHCKNCYLHHLVKERKWNSRLSKK